MQCDLPRSGQGSVSRGSVCTRKTPESGVVPHPGCKDLSVEAGAESGSNLVSVLYHLCSLLLAWNERT